MIGQQSLFQTPWMWRGRVGQSSARFSPDRRYRYELRRTWKKGLRPLVVCALNCSTADETHEDPTVRRWIGFADRWGMGSLILLNIFAFCATDPREMKRAADPIGPDNDAVLHQLFRDHRDDKLMLSWGCHGTFMKRGARVVEMARALHGRPECLGLTQNGQPSHVLYLPDASVPHLFDQLARERAEVPR